MVMTAPTSSRTGSLQPFGSTNSNAVTKKGKKKSIGYKVKYDRTFVMDHRITSDSGDTKKKSTLNEQRAFLLLASN